MDSFLKDLQLFRNSPLSLKLLFFSILAIYTSIGPTVINAISFYYLRPQLKCINPNQSYCQCSLEQKIMVFPYNYQSIVGHHEFLCENKIKEAQFLSRQNFFILLFQLVSLFISLRYKTYLIIAPLVFLFGIFIIFMSDSEFSLKLGQISLAIGNAIFYSKVFPFCYIQFSEFIVFATSVLEISWSIGCLLASINFIYSKNYQMHYFLNGIIVFPATIYIIYFYSNKQIKKNQQDYHLILSRQNLKNVYKDPSLKNGIIALNFSTAILTSYLILVYFTNTLDTNIYLSSFILYLCQGISSSIPLLINFFQRNNLVTNFRFVLFLLALILFSTLFIAKNHYFIIFVFVKILTDCSFIPIQLFVKNNLSAICKQLYFPLRVILISIVDIVLPYYKYVCQYLDLNPYLLIGTWILVTGILTYRIQQLNFI